MQKKEAIDISVLDGKFGYVTLQHEIDGITQKKIVLGTINAERKVVQEILDEDIELGGKNNVRVVDFVEANL